METQSITRTKDANTLTNEKQRCGSLYGRTGASWDRSRQKTRAGFFTQPPTKQGKPVKRTPSARQARSNGRYESWSLYRANGPPTSKSYNNGRHYPNFRSHRKDYRGPRTLHDERKQTHKLRDGPPGRHSNASREHGKTNHLERHRMAQGTFEGGVSCVPHNHVSPWNVYHWYGSANSTIGGSLMQDDKESRNLSGEHWGHWGPMPEQGGDWSYGGVNTGLLPEWYNIPVGYFRNDGSFCAFSYPSGMAPYQSPCHWSLDGASGGTGGIVSGHVSIGAYEQGGPMVAHVQCDSSQMLKPFWLVPAMVTR